MPEAKTKPTGASVDTFIAAVEHFRRRRDAETIRAVMARASGEAPMMWGASIVGFGRYRTASGDWPRMGFSPRKAALVLYVSLGEAREALMTRLSPATSKGGCIYVADLAKLDPASVRDLCETGWRYMAERHPER